MICPAPLGVGVTDESELLRRADRPRSAGGILIKLPPHRGPVTLTFDLHNRHTYSEEQVKAQPRVRQIHGDHRRVDDG